MEDTNTTETKQTPKPKRRRSIAPAQISRVLMAIQYVEGWCAEHPSITARQDGGWRLNALGYPEPSKLLLDQLTHLEELEAAPGPYTEEK